jgi:CBS domain-containing protein
MRASERMHTPAVTCRPATTVAEVGRLMGERNVGSVLVVDEVGYLAGIVTDRDIVLRGVAEGMSGDVPVERVMTRDVATITPATGLEEAAGLMVKRAVRRLPVVDAEGHPHGVLAFDDLMRHFGHEADALVDTVTQQAVQLQIGA